MKRTSLILSVLLVSLLVIISGCGPSFKDLAAQYQKDSAGIIAEFEKIQADYTEVGKNGRNPDYPIQKLMTDLKGLEERTAKAKKALGELNVPTDLRAVNEAGIKSMATYESFLRDIQVGLMTFDMAKMGGAGKIKSESEEQIRAFKGMLKDALDGKKPPSK